MIKRNYDIQTERDQQKLHKTTIFEQKLLDLGLSRAQFEELKTMEA